MADNLDCISVVVVVLALQNKTWTTRLLHLGLVYVESGSAIQLASLCSSIGRIENDQ